MKKIILIFQVLLFFHGSKALASFDENQRRYMTGEEIIWSLQQFLPTSGQPNCTGIDNPITNSAADGASKLGLDSPITGEPVSASPNQATVEWITSCVQQAMTDKNGLCADQKQLLHLLGPAGFDRITVSASGDHLSPVYYCQYNMDQLWSTWSLAEKQALIRGMVLNFLGPDSVIMDFGLIKNVDDFRKILLDKLDAKSDRTVASVITFLAMNLSIRDEFLSY